MTREQEIRAEDYLKKLRSKGTPGLKYPSEEFDTTEEVDDDTFAWLVQQGLIEINRKSNSVLVLITEKGLEFKGYRKKRRIELWDRIIKYILPVVAVLISLTTLGWNFYQKKSTLELEKRIQKLENTMKPNDNGLAPMRQKIDSISKPLETQQNQGIQEK